MSAPLATTYLSVVPTEQIDPETAPAVTAVARSAQGDASFAAPAFSSLHQTALVMVVEAGEQAKAQAAASSPEPKELARQLAEERRKNAVQRANAEQARRVAACMRISFEALLEHLAQPCMLIDTNDRILRWNPAMAQWTGISEAEAINGSVVGLLSDELLAGIQEARQILCAVDQDHAACEEQVIRLAAACLAPRRSDACAVTLLPLWRIAGVLEGIVALFEPASRKKQS